MAKKKFYAVRKGRTPGVYSDWDTCKSMVDGFPGAEYKGFASEPEALAYLNNIQAEPVQAAAPAVAPVQAGDANTAVAYVDGSFDGVQYGGGAVILHCGQEITLTASGIDPEMASMHNVAGEILGALLAVEYCLKRDIANLEIHHDYEGVGAWADGHWKTNKTGTRDYARRIAAARNDMNITFKWVHGHSGDKYNDMADKLARSAIGLA